MVVAPAEVLVVVTAGGELAGWSVGGGVIATARFGVEVTSPSGAAVGGGSMAATSGPALAASWEEPPSR